jgi:hypothetical protein
MPKQRSFWTPLRRSRVQQVHRSVVFFGVMVSFANVCFALTLQAWFSCKFGSLSFAFHLQVDSLKGSSSCAGSAMKLWKAPKVKNCSWIVRDPHPRQVLLERRLCNEKMLIFFYKPVWLLLSIELKWVAVQFFSSKLSGKSCVSYTIAFDIEFNSRKSRLFRHNLHLSRWTKMHSSRSTNAENMSYRVYIL